MLHLYWNFSPNGGDASSQPVHLFYLLCSGKVEQKVESAKPAPAKSNAVKPESSGKQKVKIEELSKVDADEDDSASDMDDSEDGSVDEDEEDSSVFFYPNL